MCLCLLCVVCCVCVKRGSRLALTFFLPLLIKFSHQLFLLFFQLMHRHTETYRDTQAREQVARQASTVLQFKQVSGGGERGVSIVRPAFTCLSSASMSSTELASCMVDSSFQMDLKATKIRAAKKKKKKKKKKGKGKGKERKDSGPCLQETNEQKQAGTAVLHSYKRFIISTCARTHSYSCFSSCALSSSSSSSSRSASVHV